MPDYRRYRIPGGCYFFTVNLLERRMDHLVKHIDILRQAVRGVRRHYPFQIDGWVVLVGGLRVEIVDKNVGNDVPLAEAATDDEGGYCATFNVTDLRQRGKQRPDLQTRIFAGETFLGASKVCYNASHRETQNVLLTEKAASSLPSARRSFSYPAIYF